MKNLVIESFQELSLTLALRARKQITLLIGIDGLSGAGKSTFTNSLVQFLKDVTIVEMDSFFFPSSQKPIGNPLLTPLGGDFDWQRLYRQVLDPLSMNIEGRYQCYDSVADRLAEWHVVPIGGLVIVEGLYSIRRELANLYDFKIWIECPRDVRLDRGIARDIVAHKAKNTGLTPEKIRELWEKDWKVNEDRYMQEQKPFQSADMIIKSSGFAYSWNQNLE